MFLWFESVLNPSDDPSRGVALRRPVPADAITKRFLRPEQTRGAGFEAPLEGGSWACLEVFSGRGRLSAALRAAGLRVASPLEALSSGPDSYVPGADISRAQVFEKLSREIEAGSYSYIHFAVPCSSFPVLRNLSSGSRTR